MTGAIKKNPQNLLYNISRKRKKVLTSRSIKYYILVFCTSAFCRTEDVVSSGKGQEKKNQNQKPTNIF